MRESPTDTANPVIFRTPLERFAAINSERLRRMRDELSFRQQQFLDLLPLLFQTNHPLLPGFVSAATPAGFCDYVPSKQSINAAQKLARTFTLQQKLSRQFDLLGLYFMGSCGTIAHSESSDFDIWLCHGPGLTNEQLDELREKATAVETWALSLNVEAHFFIFEPEHFKCGANEKLSTESSGSTQHYLLLDEFYRSGLVVAGLFPLWFEVPPEAEANYDDYVTELITRPGEQRRVYVDFGGVGHIPTEEFFGATLWQLYKSIQSPFKSVLKLLLMEVYATTYPATEVLSLQFKRAVYSGETRLLELDPYLLMCRRIEEYLKAQDDATRLDVLRRCFYLKVDEPLSKPARPNRDSWRRRHLQTMVSCWNWTVQKTSLLDGKKDWQLDTVLEQRRDLISTITQSYRMLSQFARRHVELSRISQADLVVLGRKLYIAFERKAGKLELINRGIVDTLWAAELTLLLQNDEHGDPLWSLVFGRCQINAPFDEATGRQARSAFELICWAYFNRILDRRTHVTISGTSEGLTVREVHAILGQLERLFPGGEPYSPLTRDLNSTPHLRSGTLFVNVGVDPCRTGEGFHVASARTNALSYGGERRNLALTFDLLIETSWGELFCHRYTKLNGLFECVRDYLRWAPPSTHKAPPSVNVNCFSSSYGGIIIASVSRLFQSMLLAFYGKRSGDSVRYLLDVENRHYVVQSSAYDISYVECQNFSALLKQLAAPSKNYTKTVVDDQSLRGSLLPKIYSVARPRQISLFLQSSDKHLEIYVLDEEGALYIQTLAHYDTRLLLQQFMLFFAAISRRRYIYASSHDTPFRGPKVVIYLFEKGEKGEKSLREIPYNFDGTPRSYFNIQVIIRPNETGDRSFTIYCNDKEFSSLQYGPNLFQTVASHVLTLRASGLHYPIYITDIDISPDLLSSQSENPLQTIHYLNYKKKIEDRLNDALIGGA